MAEKPLPPLTSDNVKNMYSEVIAQERKASSVCSPAKSQEELQKCSAELGAALTLTKESLTTLEKWIRLQGGTTATDQCLMPTDPLSDDNLKPLGRLCLDRAIGTALLLGDAFSFMTRAKARITATQKATKEALAPQTKI